jgi:uncharacterized membrane protein YoaK (UPF0700 family)
MPAVQPYSAGKQITLAVTLSLVGGFTNALTFIVCGNTFTSHVTGTATNFGLTLAGQPGQSAQGIFFFGGLIVAFFIGALASAAMTEGARLLGRKSGYVLPLGVEALLLAGVIASYFLREQHPNFFLAMPFIASFAMGLQNATITRISGSVIRTTHLTGVLTDLGLDGIQYGLWCWRRGRGMRRRRSRRILRISARHPIAHRLLVLIAIFVSFVSGVIAAALCFQMLSCWALLLPISLLTALIVFDWLRPISEISALDPACDPAGKEYDLAHSVLPPELAIYRLPHRSDDGPLHAPYVQHWVERIPREKKIILLVLPAGLAIRTPVIADLRQLYCRLHASGRKLLVAGVSSAQYRILDRRGYVATVGAESLHPDLEFATAHASGLARAQSPRRHSPETPPPARMRKRPEPAVVAS